MLLNLCRLTLLLAFFTLGIDAVAQTLVVTGPDGKTPVENVYIFDHSERKTSTTNYKGEAPLDAFADQDTLYFQHPSFNLYFATKKELEKKSFQLSLQRSIYSIEEFEIVTLREDHDEEVLPFKISMIGAPTIALNNPSTSADMLQQSGEVQVQKTQLGGGSPIIRGFEANRILLVVDGVRMNNAIYRSGHLQNAITVDPNMLTRTEVLFGPGSVIYGSDALGGVVHFHTKNPVLSDNDSTNALGVNAMLRFGTAAQEKAIHYDLSAGNQRFGLLSSFTATEYGDLRMGRVRNHGYDDWGLIPYYIETIEGVDTMVANPNQNVQVGTGYQQLDFGQKLLFQPNDSLAFLLNFQYSTSTDVPRYDKLNEYRDGALRFAEWNYGPQNRFLTSFKTTIKSKSRLFNRANIILAYQNIDEDRIERRVGSSTRESSLEDVDVYSFNADFNKQLDASMSLFYGFESTFNEVSSTAFSQDVFTGVRNPIQTRYPDGGSTMQTYAFYAFHNWQLSPQSKLNTGIRYNHIILNSDFLDTTFLQLPFTEIDINTGAVTGSVAYTFEPNNRWTFGAITSTGFRSPNVDDYGKVFENNARVVVPNNQLKPEYAYNGEVSITKRWFTKEPEEQTEQQLLDWVGEEVFTLQGTFFYTYLQDIIVRADWRLNDADSLLYQGEMAKIQTNINADEAVVYGTALSMRARLNRHWGMNATYNYTVGQNTTNDVPLAHIPPAFGKLGVTFRNQLLSAELFTMFNGAKDTSAYGLDPNSGSYASADNFEEATEDGTPAWYTVNLRTTWHLREALEVQFAVENILDHHYKPFASGISAPGRNFVMAFRASF